MIVVKISKAGTGGKPAVTALGVTRAEASALLESYEKAEKKNKKNKAVVVAAEGESDVK